MKTATFRLLLGAAAGVWFGAGVALGACGGDSEVAGEWIFEPEAEAPGWAINSGGDGDMGNLGLTGGAAFSTNVPPVNCDCGHSLGLPGTNGAAGAVSLGEYDPLAEAEKFTVMAWVRRESAAGENLSARIFSDADSTALTNTTAGVEFRFSGSAGNLALRINGTEVATSVGGIAPDNGEWHHVAAVYDGTRPATNYTTRNVHFYVDGIQRGVGSVLQNAVVATNDAPVVVGNASASRTAANLLAGNVDDVLVVPGWTPDAAGNGNANAAIQCFMNSADDIFPPGIAAPPDVEVEAGECLEPVAVALGNATAWDDCGVALVTNDAPATFDAGLTEVTWTATDAAGNASTAVQTAAVVPSRTGDCDEDGLTDYEEEMELGTDATLWDTDGDGWGDGEEVAMGFDPLEAGDAPKVLLNAVMYNPAGTDEGKEWVELYSASVRDVDLGGFRLEVGRNGIWTAAVELAAGRILEPGQCLLIGESAVSNADVTAVLAIPNAWTNEPTTGVRLRRGGTGERIADAVFIGGGAEFNEAELGETGWVGTNSVWAHAGALLERRFPGVDNDRPEDWHEVESRGGRDTSVVPDFDGDGLSDGDEWSGRLNPWGTPTNPWNADSDGDGLGDYAECVTHGTNPNAWASDGDIYPRPPPSGAVADWWGSDPYEIAHGWNPLVADENANGVPDSWEMAFPGGGLSADADGDGVSNLDELRQNSDPLDGDSSTAEPYVLRFESSKPGWANDGLTDVGLGGWIKVFFCGWSGDPGDRIGVAVSEGNVLEEFAVEWQGAVETETTWAENGSWVVTSASPIENTFLRIWDSALHPDFSATLGGEYTVLRLPVDLSMDGTEEGEEYTRGGFVPVNADNDNGSAVVDGIPATRDFLANGYDGEDNMVSISLAASIPEVFGGVLQLSKSENGRGRIKVWDTQHKDNEIVLPATWAVGGANFPTTLWVEGCREDKALRCTALTLAYVQNGKTNSQDSLLLTVTPVLKTLYTEASLFSPALSTNLNQKTIVSNNEMDGTPAIRFGTEVENLPGNPKGAIRLIQHGWIDNLLGENFGIVGVTGLLGKLILNHQDASEGLVDASDDDGTFPFYSPPGESAIVNIGNDSPAMFVNHVLIWPVSTGMSSRFDIRFRYRLSAVWEFDDKSIYFLGHTAWSTRFQGVLTNSVQGKTYQGGNDNRTIGGAEVILDNTDYRTSRPIAVSCAEYVLARLNPRAWMNTVIADDKQKQTKKEPLMDFRKTGLALMAALSAGTAAGGLCEEPYKGWNYAQGDHLRVFYEQSNRVFKAESPDGNDAGKLRVFQVGLQDWREPELLRFRGVCVTKKELPPPNLMRMSCVVYALPEQQPATPSEEEMKVRLAQAKWEDPISDESCFVYGPPPKPVKEVEPPLEAHRKEDGRVAVGFRQRANFYVMFEMVAEDVPPTVEVLDPWPWPDHIHPVVATPERDAVVEAWLHGVAGTGTTEEKP